MEKKKSNKFKILFFIFVAIFAVGIIGIIIPFDFEQYSYSFSNRDANTSANYNEDTHTITFKLKIDNKTNLDRFVNVTVEFEYMFKGDSEDATVTRNIPLGKGQQYITFTYTDEGWGSCIITDINSVTIKYDDGKQIEIFENSFFAGANFAFFSLAAVGFIAGAVSLILWKTSGKVFVDPVEESFGNTMRTFEERIKEAFKPVTETNKQKDVKLTCSYCKCKFDGEKYDKCPHCGAPPEPQD